MFQSLATDTSLIHCYITYAAEKAALNYCRIFGNFSSCLENRCFLQLALHIEMPGKGIPECLLSRAVNGNRIIDEEWCLLGCYAVWLL
jgi:hypothetical protein